MSKDLHPSLLEHYISTHHLSSIASWGLIWIATSLLMVGSVCKNLESRIAFAGGALACCLVARPIRRIAISTDRTQSDIADISTQSFQNWLYDRMKPDQQQVELLAPAATSEVELYDFDNVLDEAVGIALLGNSGSGKSSTAKYLASQLGDSQILVLDAHDDGKTWDGLPVINEFEDIEHQMNLLLKELDDRRKRKRQGKKLEPLVVIVDEFPATRDYCKQIGSDAADRFILRFGSECRKYDILSIFCSSSGNTKALGLEGQGDFLENYLLIRLCKIAIKYSKNLSDRSVLATLKTQGFPCLVGDDVSIHPTHGHYQRFAKNLPPKNLRPLRSLPLTIPLAVTVAYQPLARDSNPPIQPPGPSAFNPGSMPGSAPGPGSPPVQPGSDARTYLERLWNMDSAPNGSDGGTVNQPPQNRGDGGGPQDSSSGSEFPEIDGLDDDLMQSLILQFRELGITSQDDFILSCWGISKGGGRRYQRAKERYQEVCKKYGL